MDSDSDDDLLCGLVGMQGLPNATKKTSQQQTFSTQDADRKLAEEM